MITSINEFKIYLKEGLIFTYDLDLLIDTLPKLSKLKISINKESEYKFNIEINTCDIISSYMVKLINYCINLYGYFPTKYVFTLKNGMSNTKKWNSRAFENEVVKSTTAYNNYSKLQLFFESKKPDFVKNLNVVYHYTTKKYLAKILAKGLIVKSKNRLLNHLERIYVFSDLKIKDTILKNLKKSDLLNNIKNEYVLLQIDTTSKPIFFRIDPEYVDGYFTTDNIPKELITIQDGN